MPKIIVVAKVTAGTHPVHGPIVKGQQYTIEESQFAPQLFKRVTKKNPAAEPADK